MTVPRRSGAFTLLELIIVVVVLAVLAALAVPTFQRVVDNSKLRAAETTAAALTREALALAAFDGGTITTGHVTAAATDLPGQALGTGTSAAGIEGARVVFGRWEFSGGPRMLSVRLSTETAPKMGTAIWVPGAGCAFAVGQSRSTNVRTWHSRSIDQVNCNGNVAISDVDPDTLRAPAMPRLRVGANPLACPAGTWFTWDGTEPLDIYIDGQWVASTSGGYCAPAGTDLGRVVGVQRKAGSPEGAPSGWDGGAGSLSGGEEGFPTTGSSISLAGPAVVHVTSPVTGSVDVWRTSPGSLSGGTKVGTTSTGHHYDDAPAGNWGYYVIGANGTPTAATVEQATRPGGGAAGPAPSAVGLSDGSIRLSWGLVPETAKAPVDGYRLYRASASTGPWTAPYQQLSDTTDTYLDEQPGNGTWCYRLSAYGPGGESDLTAAVCVTIQIAPKAPSAVKELTAQPGSKQVTLAWKMPDTYGSPVQRYTVTVSPTTGVTGLTSRTTTSTGMVFDGLTNGNGYTFTVTATNAVGTGPGASVTAAAVAPPMGAVTAIDANYLSTCALADGVSYCWGHGEGNGGGLNLGSPRAVSYANPVPLAVTNMSGSSTAPVQGMTSSYSFACTVKDALAWCWGDGSDNHLAGASSTKTPVKINGITNVTTTAVGYSHTCAAATGSSGDGVYCWGYGAFGMPGGATPTKVSGLPAGKPTKVSSGRWYSCASWSTEVWCWGLGSSGQMGNGTTNSTNSVPQKVVGPTGNVVGIDTASGSACAATTDGVWCWGENPSKQVDTTASTTVPTPTKVVGPTGAPTGVAAGGTMSCASTTDGVWCWGSNSSGQLGNGSTNAVTGPSRVLDLGGDTSSITAGEGYACVVVTGNGRCWGQGIEGGLGDGLAYNHNATRPVNVVSG